MADKKETLLYEVKLDLGNTAQMALDAQKKLTLLRAEKKALDAQFKAGVIDIDAHTKASLVNAQAQKAASAELKEHTRTLDLNEKRTKAAQGSINQMRANLALATDQWNGLSKAERENAKTGVVVEKQAKALSDALKGNEEQIGDHRRSVGDYVKGIRVMGISVGETSESLKSGFSAAKTFASGILTTRGALVALTAVPIILILTALVSFLSRSKDGMEFLGRKTAAVTAVFDYFSKLVVGVGRAIVQAFEKGQLLTKFGDLIKENLTNRLSAFKVILDAVRNTDLKALGDGLIQLFTGITGASGKIETVAAATAAAARQGEALARSAQLIADAERRLNVERANSRAQIEKLKFISEDVSKSQAEREAAAKQAFAIENGLLQRQIALQQRRISVAKQQAELSGKSAEDLDTIAEAETALGELREASFGKQTELNNKINELRIAGIQQVLGLEIANANERLRIAKESGEDTFAIQKEILEKQFALDASALVKGSDQEKALQIKLGADLALLKLTSVIELEDELYQTQTAAIEARLLLVRKGGKEELELLKELAVIRSAQEDIDITRSVKNKKNQDEQIKASEQRLTAELLKIDKQRRDSQRSEAQASIDKRLSDSRVGSRAEYQAKQAQLIIEQQAELDNADLTERRIAAIKAKYRRAERDLAKDYLLKQIEDVSSYLTQATSGLSKLTDAQGQAQTNALRKAQDAQLASAGLNADERAKIEERFAKRRLTLEREIAEKKRKYASIQNLIDTARSVTVAFVEYGPILGAILAGVALANGLAQQAIIDGQQFANGGFVSDGKGDTVHGPGTAKSDSIPARLSNGESVINAAATKKHYNLLSALNQSTGGRAFPGASIGHSVQIPSFAYGGVAYRQPAVTTAQIDSSAIAGIVSKAVIDAVANLPAPQVAVTDIQNRTAQVVRVQVRTNK